MQHTNRRTTQITNRFKKKINNSNHSNTIAGEEEDSIASRRRRRNKTRRTLLTDRQQDDQVQGQRTYTSQAQQIINDRRLPTHQSQITPSEEDNSYEY